METLPSLPASFDPMIEDKRPLSPLSDDPMDAADLGADEDGWKAVDKTGKHSGAAKGSHST